MVVQGLRPDDFSVWIVLVDGPPPLLCVFVRQTTQSVGKGGDTTPLGPVVQKVDGKIETVGEKEGFCLGRSDQEAQQAKEGSKTAATVCSRHLQR